MSRIVSINWVTTHDLTHCAASSFLAYILKQTYYFLGGRRFLMGICNFILNDFWVSVVLTSSWALGEVALWLFFFVFKMTDYYHQQHRLQLEFDHFGIFTDYFSMISPGFLCTAVVVVDDVVLGDYELSVISMFLYFVLWQMNFIQVMKED